MTKYEETFFSLLLTACFENTKQGIEKCFSLVTFILELVLFSNSALSEISTFDCSDHLSRNSVMELSVFEIILFTVSWF